MIRLASLASFVLCLVLAPADAPALHPRGPVPIDSGEVSLPIGKGWTVSRPTFGRAARGDTIVVLADAGLAASPIAPDGTLTADPGDDLAKLAVLALDAIRSGNWWLLASLVLSLVLSALRKWGPGLLASKWPAGAAWLTSDVGGAVMVLALGLLGGIVTALAGGAPIGAALLLDAVKVSLGSAGGFVLVKKLLGPSKAAVDEAGEKAVRSNPGGGASAVVGESKPLGA